jgi:hypothetical protein
MTFITTYTEMMERTIIISIRRRRILITAPDEASTHDHHHPSEKYKTQTRSTGHPRISFFSRGGTLGKIL